MAPWQGSAREGPPAVYPALCGLSGKCGCPLSLPRAVSTTSRKGGPSSCFFAGHTAGPLTLEAHPGQN